MLIQKYNEAKKTDRYLFFHSQGFKISIIELKSRYQQGYAPSTG
jgi:hypothetical protein